MEIRQYIQENENRFLEELFSLIRIPSISALPQHKEDMLACAERWRQLLLEAGADEAYIMPSQGNPLVYAEKQVDPQAPTVLVYAHYDVMPAEPLELWKSQPFEPEIRDGRIWARGSDDDKGQAMIQAKAFEYLVREVHFRRRRRNRFAQSERFSERAQGAAEGRCHPGFRHQHAGCRPAFPHHRSERTGLLGNRSDGSEPRPSFRPFRRSGSQSHQYLVQPAGTGDRYRRTHHHPAFL